MRDLGKSTRHFLATSVVVTLFLYMGDLPAAAPKLAYRETTKVLQLTGDFDRQRQEPTFSLTESKAGMIATDLGSSFEHRGRLAFLFGDTWGRHGDHDVLAFSESTELTSLTLTIPLEEDGKFRIIKPGDLPTGAFCVPSCGTSLDRTMYVVYTGDVAGEHMGQSHFLKSMDDGKTWEVLYQLSADDPDTRDVFEGKFVNAYLAEMADGTVYLWGSGKYRASDLYLARTTKDRIEDREGWIYFSGISQSGAPRWSPAESHAVPLIGTNQIGELSCVYTEEIKSWLLVYNSANPRGIVLHSAERPWGPWSEAEIIFEPWRDEGYGHFMQIRKGHGSEDQLHDENREDEWGGEYGPYLIPRFFERREGDFEIYYTMSTWNPYQVVLMKTVLTVRE